MKRKTIWIWSAGLVLAVLPLAGGGQESTTAVVAGPAATVSTTNLDIPDGTALANGGSDAEDAEEAALENAPGEVVSTGAPPAALKLSAPAAEVAKLAQAGLDESVMLAFVTNSPYVFRLTSDDIVYLNDLGVAGSVVTAMIQHDQQLTGTSPTTEVASAPAYTNPPMATAPPPEVVQNGQPEQANVTYTYFYGSLAPYGSWINISGYGLCWQPTVVVANPGWQPYCDRGRWAYSDCGWYWASDYSWGWAAFHYGRWFRHSRWGWCWAPDTVWGPSWVSWRYTHDFCAWSPLPPTACFIPGFGFRHGWHPHGLRASVETVVPINRFFDRHLDRHRVPGHQTRELLRNSVAVNNIVQRDRNVINEGIPAAHISAGTRTPIHRMEIRDASDPSSTRLDRLERDNRGALAVFRPNLPTPTRPTAFVGQGVRPAAGSRDNGRREGVTSIFNNNNNNNNNPNSGPARQPSTTASRDRDRDGRADTVVNSTTQPSAPVQNDGRSDNSARSARNSDGSRGTQPLIFRGANRPESSGRSGPSSDQGNGGNRPGQNNPDRSRQSPPILLPPRPAPTQPSPATAQQPAPAPANPSPPVANPSRQQPRQQPTVTAPRTQNFDRSNQGDWQSQAGSRQQSPNFWQQVQRESPQPAPTYRQQQSPPTRQFEYQQPQRTMNSAPERSAPAPSMRSQPSGGGNNGGGNNGGGGNGGNNSGGGGNNGGGNNSGGGGGGRQSSGSDSRGRDSSLGGMFRNR